MKIKKINILIVGSEGYIGSRLCKYLIEKIQSINPKMKVITIGETELL